MHWLDFFKSTIGAHPHCPENHFVIADAHVHVGQFYEKYYAPGLIVELMTECGVSKYLVSSTSTCEGDYNKVIDEFHTLLQMDPERVLPCLWLTEPGLNKGILRKLLSAGIAWKCIKIHPALNISEFRPGSKAINDIFSLCRQLSVPLLIHTGEDAFDSSSLYENEFELYDDVTVILAHGRPIDEAIRMAQKFRNIYIDTAFMPATGIARIHKAGLIHKLIWGSDLCIPAYFDKRFDSSEFYKKFPQKLLKIMSRDEVAALLYHNFRKIVLF